MDERQELAARLCVMVGTMMEDASVEAVTTACDAGDLRRKVAHLRDVVNLAGQMLAIAQTLLERP